MTIPKSLIISGIKWTIKFTNRSGGGFFWISHRIEIDKALDKERKFNILIHEVCEIIMVNNIMRYQKGWDAPPTNGDYLFNFDHDRFEIFAEELSGVLKQMGFR